MFKVILLLVFSTNSCAQLTFANIESVEKNISLLNYPTEYKNKRIQGVIRFEIFTKNGVITWKKIIQNNLKSKLSEEKIDGKIFTDYISNKWQFPKEGDYLFSFMFNLELKESALIKKDLPLIPFYINKIRGLPTYKVITFCDDEKNYQVTMSSHGIIYSFVINMKSCY